MLPHSPPLPVAATYELATKTLQVTFDRPLVPGLSAAGNWQYRQAGLPPTNWWNTAPAVIAGNTVTTPLVLGGAAPPAIGTCKYNAAPADVLSLRPPHLPAAAFTDFPTPII